MSYGRMNDAETKLEEEVRKLLEEAERIDAEEDALFGKGNRGDELPEELRHRESRLKEFAKRRPSSKPKRGPSGRTSCRAQEEARGARAQRRRDREKDSRQAASHT
jgi:hypothetical protein